MSCSISPIWSSLGPQALPAIDKVLSHHSANRKWPLASAASACREQHKQIMASWRSWSFRGFGCSVTWSSAPTRTAAERQDDWPEQTLTHRILTVDDDLHIREVIRVALSKAGMTVVEARDGKEALARFAGDAARPDRARYRHARARRARRLPAGPKVLRGADPVPDRPRRGNRPRARPRDRRRRLCDKAVQPARAGRAGQRDPAPRRPREAETASRGRRRSPRAACRSIPASTSPTLPAGRCGSRQSSSASCARF